MKNYKFLLKTPLKKQWQKIGIRKRAGTIFPLFSIFSKESLGIGEIPDLKLVIDWSEITGNTVLQILPLNDTGFDFSPFNPKSSFALDPVYLSLRSLIGVKKENLEGEINDLIEKFSLDVERPLKTKFVNWQIKKEKLNKLWQIFLERAKFPSKFQKFVKKQKFWLEDYALYRVLKEAHQEKSWEDWLRLFKNRSKGVIFEVRKKYRQKIKFQKWLQWQLFEQFKEIKNYARKKKIFLKGDLPFSVSRDSADVWQNKKYFKLDFASGAPPDHFSTKGQRWGYPPYNWEEILKDNFIYFRQKLEYFQNFYDLFRLDHVVGLFRIWAIPVKTLVAKQGKIGFFIPKNKKIWEKQGRRILESIIKNTKMLPCAEDLGTIPSFCPKILEELGIPGLDVQRWKRNWQNLEYLKPEEYRPLAVATLSTHDLNHFPAWWEEETTKKDFKKFWKMISLKGKIPRKAEKRLIKKNLELINHSASIFSILSIFEWLFLTDLLKEKPSQYRINIPGKILKRNFSRRLPISLEDLINHPLNNKIKEIIKKSGRI